MNWNVCMALHAVQKGEKMTPNKNKPPRRNKKAYSNR